MSGPYGAHNVGAKPEACLAFVRVGFEIAGTAYGSLDHFHAVQILCECGDLAARLIRVGALGCVFE
jgi:hypothetical protein